MTTLRIITGSANPELAGALANLLGVGPPDTVLERFPDGELLPTVENVGGSDVYLVQPTPPPVNDHLAELLLLLDACRRAHAARVTAVMPYLGYARQDRRIRAGQAVGVAVFTRAIAAAGADRLVVVDPHTSALEAICPVPVEILTAVPVLGREIALSDRVVVAPDEGAVKLAERYAQVSPNPLAVVRKRRLSGTEVTALELIGDVRGRLPVIVDDMISTGATISTALGLLRSRHAAPDVIVAATHGVFTHGAVGHLRRFGLKRILLTDTVAHRDLPPEFEVCSIAPLLADAVAALHNDEPLPASARATAR
ncbi:ribose-phosphate diphosphokinase [Nocardia nova]|jgi:ribose-phosphate pyrophosphokinase|uniref:ribose-phosphate diphosphokinase n=1 Tax=Nocardia TaxID=1817 RepID=UPI000A7B58A2|nr:MULTISPECIES: ribose-phosphate pyrophosphokinase [Nocardia]MBV7705878.1 ribose-phosphate pyrophosphokinase [Nocardia nova]